jgi:hypothetical protein
MPRRGVVEIDAQRDSEEGERVHASVAILDEARTTHLEGPTTSR